MGYEIIHADCLKAMQGMKTDSIDAAILSPPYPGIKRNYGYWKPAEWLPWMNEVMQELRRVIKPSGSAVVVIEPNFEKIGKRNTWAWEFALNMAKEWGIVQDAYWIKKAPMPGQLQGLMRNAVVWCLWVGEPDCFRNQKAVLTPYSKDMLRQIAGQRAHEGVVAYPSGHRRNYANVKNNGGASPLNYQLIATSGYKKHPACMPIKLAEYWVKYICPPQGTLIDPFAGSGTTGAACIRHDRNFIGVEIMDEYIPIIKDRLREETQAA